MAPRAYIRVLLDLVDRKVRAGYTSDQIVAYVQLLLKGALQPQPGRFVNARVLKGWLGERHARHAAHLIESHDLVYTGVDGELYIDGWDELQEGDETVSERVRRYRERRKTQPDLPLESSQDFLNGSRYIGNKTVQMLDADALSKQMGKGDGGERVYEAWRASLPPGTRASFTNRRRLKVKARLEAGYSVDDLCAAVSRGWKIDAERWPARNDPGACDLAILMRNDEQAEKFINLALNGPPPTPLFKPNGAAARLAARLQAIDAMPIPVGT